MSHTGITDSPFKFRNRAGQKFQQAKQNCERLVVPIYSFVSPVASRSLRESNNIDVTKKEPSKAREQLRHQKLNAQLGDCLRISFFPL